MSARACRGLPIAASFALAATLATVLQGCWETEWRIQCRRACQVLVSCHDDIQVIQTHPKCAIKAEYFFRHEEGACEVSEKLSGAYYTLAERAACSYAEGGGRPGLEKELLHAGVDTFSELARLQQEESEHNDEVRQDLRLSKFSETHATFNAEYKALQEESYRKGASSPLQRSADRKKGGGLTSPGKTGFDGFGIRATSIMGRTEHDQVGPIATEVPVESEEEEASPLVQVPANLDGLGHDEPDDQ